MIFERIPTSTRSSPPYWPSPADRRFAQATSALPCGYACPSSLKTAMRSFSGSNLPLATYTKPPVYRPRPRPSFFSPSSICHAVNLAHPPSASPLPQPRTPARLLCRKPFDALFEAEQRCILSVFVAVGDLSIPRQ
ncbi:hypothetical protein CC78DRAFT_388551 [Lojkania enalia]|uniref:Uncharacterized protein n=1 Tax=Lojkania enalia TaxID=147567 RepID=A0A9P4N6J7_9PLEO|nr:hypothetical protein CC78DRAFT_388551 [Didymosphaeria enalia]